MMMQRRNARNSNGRPPSHDKNGSSASAQTGITGIRPNGGRGDGNAAVISTWVLVLIAVALTVANCMFPSEVEQAEQELVKEAYAAEQRLESEMMDWWASNGHHPAPIAEGGGGDPHRNTAETKHAATERMMNQDSRWVDGEKKLKRELQKLVARQRQGKDLGVPVLTRWLGDDVPAWAGEGVNVDEWNAKVKARYDEMRQEEERWREMVAATLQNEKRG